MEEQTYEYNFGSELIVGGEGSPTPPPKKRRTVGFGLAVGLICFFTVAAILFTAVASTLLAHVYYADKLQEQEEMIEKLREEGRTCDLELERLEALVSVFERYAYYYGKIDNEEIITALLRDYAELTGDRYATYYTEEEYQAMAESNAGNHVGLGIGIFSTKLTFAGTERSVLQVTEVYPEGPAAESGLLAGDYIYGYFKDDVFYTVEEVGYDQALTDLRGVAGSEARIAVYRATNGGVVVTLEFTILRRVYVASSVSSRMSVTDPTVAIVRIVQFDLQTPVGIKREIQARLADGAEKFIFDVRNNPGGDLQSVKATLTYFLQPGDLIMNTIDRDGTVHQSYVAEVMNLRGNYATCNVTEEEIGMYADLDMVVLCNGSSASAAEVFTATLRDHGLATVVGEKTFGKGIMQTVLDLSSFGGSGFFKMTTYAYVTECGVSYHEVGIEPSVKASLSEEAAGIYPTLLPETMDNQLLAAVRTLQNGN